MARRRSRSMAIGGRAQWRNTLKCASVIAVDAHACGQRCDESYRDMPSFIQTMSSVVATCSSARPYVRQSATQSEKKLH
jgi:hypothetical protein